ncbi:MAG: metal-sensitive transcriptional regulator [Acidimicrobiaceae bacterium]|nr:metal-sensitive transcriptional regulator [Acidimicrobiaceae bacterium]
MPVVDSTKFASFQGTDVEAVQKRLSRIEGQIRGIKKMIDDGRNCKDVVTQFAAVSRALEQAAFGLVASQLTYCIEFPDEAKQAGYSVDEVKRLLSRLR